MSAASKINRGLETPANGAGRSILIIASRFAPQTGAGATRIIKTVKYLREIGWHPVVMTGEAAADSDPASEVPHNVPIVRIPAASGSANMQTLEPFIRAAATITAPLGKGDNWWRQGLRWRAERLRHKLSFPDIGIWRAADALREARRLHARQPFDVIFSSGKPFSDHLIALAIQSALHRPWVAEFRDPWFEYAHAPQWETAIGREITRRAEQAVISRARFVVSVSPAMSRRFRERYPTERAAKFVTVMNGYDPDDFSHGGHDDAAMPSIFREKRFVVLHAGSFYSERRPDPLLRAFAKFIERDETRRDRAALALAGRLGEFETTVADFAQAAPVHAIGNLPHRVTLRCMRRAALNVLVLPGGPGTQGDLSTKIFEYLAAGQPILAAVAHDGAAAAFLENFDGVARVEPDDEAAIGAVLESAYEKWQTAAPAPKRDPQSLVRLTRKHQTDHLSQVLELAVATRRRAVKPRVAQETPQTEEAACP